MHTVYPALAHSVPGGEFMLDDPATRAFNDQHCAKLHHSGIVAWNGDRRDDVATGHAVVCARRRGLSKQRIQAELRQSCATFSDDSSVSPDPERAPRSQPCPSWWKRWLDEER